MKTERPHPAATALLHGLFWLVLSVPVHPVTAAVTQRATEEVESGVSFRVRGGQTVIDVGGPAQPLCEPACEAPKVCQCTCNRQDCGPDEPLEDCGPCNCECL